MNNLAYKAANVIKSILSSDEYQLKPHYHQQLDKAWYLIPPRIKTKKLKSPFYYLGKFTFSVDEHKNEQYLFIGNHVEKGSLSSTPTGENWFWNTFIKRVRVGEFEQDLLDVSNTLNDKIIIQIDAHLGEQPNRVTDTLIYHLENGEIVYSSRQEQNEKNGGKEHFNVLKNVPSDTEGICKVIDAISLEQWAWIDVYFGVGTPLNSCTEEQIKALWFNGLFQLQKYASEYIDS